MNGASAQVRGGFRGSDGVEFGAQQNGPERGVGTSSRGLIDAIEERQLMSNSTPNSGPPAPPTLTYVGPMPARPIDYYALTSFSQRECYVYVLASDDGIVLYVGMSSSPGRRFDAHKRRAWWHEVAQVALIRVERENELRARRAAFEIEAEAIRWFGPAFNIAGVSA